MLKLLFLSFRSFSYPIYSMCSLNIGLHSTCKITTFYIKHYWDCNREWRLRGWRQPCVNPERIPGPLDSRQEHTLDGSDKLTLSDQQAGSGALFNTGWQTRSESIIQRAKSKRQSVINQVKRYISGGGKKQNRRANKVKNITKQRHYKKQMVG